MNIKENLFDIATVFWRDWVVLKRRMAKFILSRMVAPMLYLVAFGWGLGRSIEVSSGTYLDFLVPGILALNSMNISFNSITPVHAERIYHKSLEEYMIAPIWPDAFLIGKVAAAVVRALISSAIIVILALLFGAHFQMTPLFLLVLVLNCIVFAEIGFLAAMKIRTRSVGMRWTKPGGGNRETRRGRSVGAWRYGHLSAAQSRRYAMCVVLRQAPRVA